MVFGGQLCVKSKNMNPIPVPKEHRVSHGEKTTLVHKAHAQRRTGGQENSGEAGGDEGGGVIPLKEFLKGRRHLPNRGKLPLRRSTGRNIQGQDGATEGSLWGSGNK